jgi:hypothetical protein
MKAKSALRLSKGMFLSAACACLALSAGCASRTTSTGGHETTILGGAVDVTTNSFEPTTPATVDADTSKIIGKNGPSGKKVSLLWGLITLHDY